MIDNMFAFQADTVHRNPLLGFTRMSSEKADFGVGRGIFDVLSKLRVTTKSPL